MACPSDKGSSLTHFHTAASVPIVYSMLSDIMFSQLLCGVANFYFYTLARM